MYLYFPDTPRTFKHLPPKCSAVPQLISVSLIFANQSVARFIINSLPAIYLSCKHLTSILYPTICRTAHIMKVFITSTVSVLSLPTIYFPFSQPVILRTRYSTNAGKHPYKFILYT